MKEGQTMNSKMSQQQSDRRQFLATTTGVLGAVAGVGYFAGTSAAQQSTSPNERLNLAAVGSTGRAGANIKGCATQNIIAIADIDSELLDKGCQPYPNAKKYIDFREMLDSEAEKRIDSNRRRQEVRSRRRDQGHFVDKGRRRGK